MNKMKVYVSVQSDYPVIAVESVLEFRSQLARQLEMEPGARSTPRDRRWRPRITEMLEVSMDRDLQERYAAAREEWAAVQALLHQELGDDIMAGLKNSEIVSVTQRDLRRRQQPRPEWIAEDTAAEWGFPLEQ